jgi:hypothetical protein
MMDIAVISGIRCQLLENPRWPQAARLPSRFSRWGAARQVGLICYSAQPTVIAY